MKKLSHLRKRGLAIFLALIMCLGFLPTTALAGEAKTGWNGTAASSFAGGKGTDADPYQIATAEQLALMAEKIENDVNYRRASYQLVEDINLYNAYKKWTPMGKTASSAFSGKLIGNGKTISNLAVESNEAKPMGLFGYTAGAEICNLTIRDAEVKHTGGAISNPNYDVYAAVFVGCAKANTKLCNVHAVNANVSSGARAGGIVGVLYNGGTVCCSSIENTHVKVIGEYGNTVSFAGGIVGGNYFMSGSSRRAYIRRCWTDATSTVTGKYAGGMMGSGQSSSNAPYYTIEDCYNLASVTGNSQSAGIVSWGRGYSTTDPIERCYNAGAINGSSSSTICSGIVCYGGNNYTGALKNCVNFGTITTSSNKSDAIAADNYTKTEPFSSNGCLYESGSLVLNGVSGKGGMPREDILSVTTTNTDYFGNSDVWIVNGGGLPTLKRCQGNDDCMCKCVPTPDSGDIETTPNLTIAKTVTPTENVKVGDWLTYTITVTNPSEAMKNAENVVVTDVLPEGLDVSTVKMGLKYQGYTVSCEGQTLTWTVGELEPGASKELTFEVQTNKAVEIKNTASVYKDNNTDPDATTPEEGAKVTVGDATTEDPSAPVKPEPKDLPEILGSGFVTVHCDNVVADHADRKYTLVYDQSGKAQGIEIADPVESGTEGVKTWTCKVTVSAEPYVKRYDADTHNVEHSPATGSQDLTLTWTEGKWVADPDVKTVTFNVSCGEKPAKPEPKDLPGILKAANGFVVVDCGNTEVEHADRTYDLIYKSGQVQGITIDEPQKSGDAWTCVVTVAADPYVTQYNADTKVTHTTQGTSKTLTLTWSENKWTAEPDKNTVTFNVTCNEKAPEPVKPKLQSILKAQVNPDQLPDSVTLPDGMTRDSFVTVDGKLKFPEGAETVNVLYRITVVGEKGAKYTVTDEGATWISGGTVDETATSLTVTGTLASSMEDIYVYKTFSKNDSITNTATLKPTDDSTDPADGADEKGEISTPPVVTPVETETPDTREPYQMTIQKLVNGKGSAEVTVGDKFTYMVVLDNTGKNPLYQLKITDTMAAGLELVDVSSAFHRRSGETELVQLTATTSEDKLKSEWAVEEFGSGDEVVLVYQATATKATEDNKTLDNDVQATAKKKLPASVQQIQILSDDIVQVNASTTVTSDDNDDEDISVDIKVPVTVKPGSGGGDDPNPPQPTTPDAPTTKDDINGDVSVKVYCTTEDSGHTDGSYNLMNGGFTAGEVAGNEDAGYTCDITINPGFYVAQYGNGHWVDDSQTLDLSVTLTWNAETGTWDVPTNALVSIPAKCLLSQDAGNYTVEHYKETLDGDYELAETDTLSAKYGEVTATPRSYTGFTYANGHQDEVKSGEVSATNAPVLKLYYSRNTYTVSYVYEGERPVDAPDAPEAQEVKYGETVTVENAPTSVKGMFSGWDTNDANVSGDSFEMPANNVTFTGTWEMEEPPVDPEIPPLADSVADLVAEIGVNLECTTDESHNRDSVEVKYSFTDDGEGNGTITISPRSYLSDMPSPPAHGLLDVDDVVLVACYVEDDNDEGEPLDDPASQEPTGHWELVDAPKSITFQFLCVPEEEGCDHTVGEDGYCKEPGCDHGPDCPNCHGPAPVEPVAKYTVTYTDGLTGEEVFANQVYTVEENAATPAFDGTPSRDGYQFAGWDPTVADTVTDHVVYTAKWSHTDADHRDDDHDGKCDFCGECMHHKDGNGYCTEEGCDHDGGCCPKPSEEPEEKTYRLTIQYIYTNGQTASASYTADLKAGESYSVTSPSISGFTPSQTVMSGTMGEGNETYTVVYSRNATTVTVTWRNWDGTVLDQAYWVSNEREPAYSGRRPTRPDSGRYTYTFAGWGDREVDENGNVTYTAQFDRERIYDAGTGGGTGGSTGGGTGGSTTTTPPATIPDNPSPLDPGTTIDDQNVPLAGAVGLNATDHFAYINGYEDDTVRPMKDITRAEVAAIFFRLMTEEYRVANWATENTFSDVKAGDWYNNAISTCVKAGIIKGYEDGTFRPGQSITRAEFAAIAARFLGPDANDEGVGDFADTADKWYSADVRKAAKAGWISGMGGNRFEPDAKITRAQVMSIVNRMLDRTPDADHMLPEMKKWTDNPEGTWYYVDVQEATNGHDYTRDETNVETWTAIQAKRDWVEIEAGWAANNGASTPAAAVETQGLPDGI